MTDETALPDDFNGTVRLFPLPDFVLFPHVVTPLHIFEPRYRAMTEAALESDQVIAMALLKSDWDDYQGQPPIYSVVCVSKILSHVRSADGRYNVLVAGLERGRILHELDFGHPYREAQVELLTNELPSATDLEESLQLELLARFRDLMGQYPQVFDELDVLIGESPGLDMLTDIIAYTVSLPAVVKHELLADHDVERRATRLLAALETCKKRPTGAVMGGFPPDFSKN